MELLTTVQNVGRTNCAGSLRATHAQGNWLTPSQVFCWISIHMSIGYSQDLNTKDNNHSENKLCSVHC